MKVIEFLQQLEFPRRKLPLKPRKKNSAPRLSGLISDPELSLWCQEKAKEFQLKKLEQSISVEWNSRMRTTAGRAWWPQGKIELNPKLKTISEEEIWRTLKHELAHLIAFARHGRKISPHGIEWRIACAELGIADETPRHSLPFEPRKIRRKHAYQCPVCLQTILRVRPFRRVVACFTCCKKENQAKFLLKYRLVKISLPGKI